MTDTYRNESRKDWYQSGESKPNREQLQLGCLQRIADATETMATDYQRLLRDNEVLKRWGHRHQDECEKLRRRLSAMKGANTKLRQKLQQAREQPK